MFIIVSNSSLLAVDVMVTYAFFFIWNIANYYSVYLWLSFYFSLNIWLCKPVGNSIKFPVYIPCFAIITRLRRLFKDFGSLET